MLNETWVLLWMVLSWKIFEVKFKYLIKECYKVKSISCLMLQCAIMWEYFNDQQPHSPSVIGNFAIDCILFHKGHYSTNVSLSTYLNEVL